MLYHAKGDHAHREPIYRQAVAIGRRRSARTTPSTPRPSNNLAGLYLGDGRPRPSRADAPRGASGNR